MNEPKLAISSWVCKYPEDIFEVVYKTDFQAIEWDLDYIPVPLSSHRRRKFKQKIDELNISIRYHLPHSTCDVGSENPRIRKISEKYLLLNIELLEEMGADYAVLHFGQHEGEKIPKMSSLSNVVGGASKHGIKIAVENLTIGPSSNLKSLKQILSESGAELALDVGHAKKVNALREFLLSFSSKITHVHFYGSEDDFYNHRAFSSDLDALETAEYLRKRIGADWWTLEMDNLQECIHLLDVLRGRWRQ